MQDSAQTMSVDDKNELDWLLGWRPDESPCDIAKVTRHLSCKQVLFYLHL